MPANYVLLEKITVGAAGASSVTFSGIPQTGYTDLVVKASTRSNRADGSDWIRIDVNGVNSSYTDRKLIGDGSSASSQTSSSTVGFPIDGNTATASTFANSEIYIPNYTSSNYKSFSIDTVSETNGTTAYTGLIAGLWSSTSAITSLTLVPNYSTGFVQYSTFYLYGVAKLGTTPAIQPYATGGDTIMTDGTYWYHTFISSGTFTPAKAITCDYLVVAGGGGGGGQQGGGGGAGGLRSTVTATGGGGSLESALSLASGTGYTVTVGAGGAGAGVSSDANGTNGSNSVFSTITSTGGGGGGGNINSTVSVGNAGGSGGGNGEGSLTTNTGTANQGYKGGSAYDAGNYYGSGGGGGAGAVGANGTAVGGGNGGNGVAVAITGSSVTYAGGAGGSASSGGGVAGTGGTGGGGNGGLFNSNNGTAGTPNTGGGGGGASGVQAALAGGSGLVIVRYAV